MSVPQTTTGSALPPDDVVRPAGLALRADHPLVMAAWLAVGLAIAVGVGPWLSKAAGIMLPAFALVRTKS